MEIFFFTITIILLLGRVEYHTYFETQVYDYQFIDQVYYYHAPTCSL